jgi:pyruvate dehydrogenase E2 component (dihydrolipoamide acetyltransferase)
MNVAVEIVMPRLSDSMEEGTILSWLVAPGDPVEPGQPLAEIETDKANAIYEADDAGVILALHAVAGETVAVGVPIALLGAEGEEPSAFGVPAAAAAAPAPATAAVAGAPPPDRPRSTRSARPKASPLARRVAAQLSVDLTSIAGSGPGGRVIRADVEGAAAIGRAETAAGANGHGEAHAASASEPPTTAKGETSVQPLTRLQETVARRMAQSRATVPDIELRVEVDMGEAVELRQRLREVADPAPSINDFVVKAAALALREFPRVNGAYRDEGFETYARVNVGIAVAAEDALVVPTIVDADRRPLGEIAAAARTLAARVRDGSISPSELSGATFTVSNLGMHGVDSFSAVINLPQAAILAVGSLRRRPVVDEPSGEIHARPTIVLTLACDHRIIYGVDGARFLSRVRELLERPHALLL